jgi:polysaccharide biosynthesis protein PslH
VTLREHIFRLLGKDPEAVVVSFLSGPESLARAMLAEVMQLIPDREHFAITDLHVDDVRCVKPADLKRTLRRKRIGLAPTLFAGNAPEFRSMRRVAFLRAPRKILAFNERLERHHLKLQTPVASMLFLRGVPLDRIFLRPSWLFPWRSDRTRRPETHSEFEGRPLSEGRRRVAVLSPYVPYPLSHGGAVRIFNMLREAARDFDVFLFAFSENHQAIGDPVLDLCARVILFPNPRYREPRWSTLLPPEVCEFRSPYVRQAVDEYRHRFDLRLLQVEYTQLASYGGDVLVEHDVTFDLYDQVRRRDRTWRAWWDWKRWRWYEMRAVRKFPRVVVMSDKDAGLLGTPNARIIPNGVDLERFSPAPEPPGWRLLFVGSFRHFPNVIAYRFFVEQVWPLLSARIEGLRLTVIAGPDPHLYWSTPPPDPRIEIHAFIADVRPFYEACNVVIVPTQVSAGTNLKVLEAMASGRAVVSTTSGCAGLGLTHGESVWIADTADEFAGAVHTLLLDGDLRQSIANAGRRYAEKHFAWRQIASAQKRMWLELLTGVIVRRATRADLPAITRIQKASHFASQWEPESYFEFDVRVAERKGEIYGFMVSRDIVDEVEVLNVAVDAGRRREGVATALIGSVNDRDVFLEVRESNTPARNLYTKLGFTVVGERREYYENPVESALVMRLSRTAENDTF